MGKQRAFTLIEILIVIAILLLLAALIFPVMVRSKEAAKAAACTSNLRQAYIAWSLYTDAHDGYPPGQIEQFIDDNSKLAIMKCPSDTYLPGSNRIASDRIGEKISYFYSGSPHAFWADLEKADANHGVLVCVTHGEAVGDAAIVNPLNDTTGLVLRLRMDGSVTRAKVGHICVDPPEGGFMKSRAKWLLFSDVWPCPERWCPTGSYKCQ